VYEFGKGEIENVEFGIPFGGSIDEVPLLGVVGSSDICHDNVVRTRVEENVASRGFVFVFDGSVDVSKQKKDDDDREVGDCVERNQKSGQM
jgi:hypothetical protein